MWSPQYEIIVETLTGSEFEVSVTEKDTVGYIKSKIQKYEGIPIGQQHLIYKYEELKDGTKIKDIPLIRGSRVKLVLNMKGGPVSARRIVNLPDYDSWFDISDVFSTRNESSKMSTPGVKLLVFKDSAKNTHRIMKFRPERRGNEIAKSNESRSPKSDAQEDQWMKDNIQTLEKMQDLRSLLENQKKNKDILDKLIENKNKGANSVDYNQTDLLTFEHDSKEYIKPGIYDNTMSLRKNTSLLNKYGLNKTCIRPPTLINRSKGCKTIQLHALSPLTPQPLSYGAPYKSSEIGIKARNTLRHLNIINKSNNIEKIESRSNCELSNISNDDVQLKIRENVKRNRSFKTINMLDIYSEEFSNRSLNSNGSLSSVLDQIFGKTNKRLIEKKASKSVQDLIEKINSAKLGTKLIDPLIKQKSTADIDQDRESWISNRGNFQSVTTSKPAAGYENKLFIDRKKTITLNSIDSSICSSDFNLESSNSITNGALDGPFRLYKVAAEAAKSYELPKLLIREDSPVESFHSSDPQLETLTIRSESPKNVVDTYPKLVPPDTTLKTTTAEKRDIKLNKTNLNSPWNHHHSDLGLNSLELNFLNDDFSDIDNDQTSNCLNNGSVLKIASDLEINSNWNDKIELDRTTKASKKSLSLINDDVFSDEDVFNNGYCMMHGSSKSKSIEVNEFRMMFGSSPTLFNTNYNSVAHTSRLDAVPIQYRRGYTNLNDACLSSSTSDLELLNGVRKKNSSKSASQELPSSFSRHKTTNSSLDFVRSYENLDRTKILRMKNELGITDNTIIRNSDKHNFWDRSVGTKLLHSIQNNFSNERLQEEDMCNDDYSYSNMIYDSKNINRQGGIMNDCLPDNFTSEESLLNMNLEQFADDFNLLSSASLSDRLSISSNNNSKDTSRSSLLLSEIENDGFNNMKISNNNDLQTDNISTKILNKEELIIKKPKKQRCAECNKKLGLIMIMKCHCQKVFCPQHRYAEAHNCSYNFKSEGKKIIARENPLVIAERLSKI